MSPLLYDFLIAFLVLAFGVTLYILWVFINVRKDSHTSEPEDYPFETLNNENRRILGSVPNENDTDDYRVKLFLRLGAKNLIPEFKKNNTAEEKERLEVLNKYVITIHKNIEWYVKARKGQMNKHVVFRNITFLMLILIPFLIYGANFYVSNYTKLDIGGTENIIAIITGFLTTVFAFHRGYNAWLKNQQRVNAFWKASSELKAILYSFEEKWKGKPIDDKLSDFIEDMKSGTAEGILIEKGERNSFFENYSLPEFNLGTMLPTAQTNASSFLSKSQSQRLKNKIEAENKILKEDYTNRLPEDKEQIENELNYYRNLYLKYENRLEAIKDEPLKKAEIKSLEQKMAEISNKIIEKKSILDVYYLTAQ